MIERVNEKTIGSFCGCNEYAYNVIMDKKMTLEEFCLDVISCEPKEWGYIGVHKMGSLFGDPKIEYGHGELLRRFDDDYGKRYVKTARCTGSWSRIDYIVRLEEE